MVSLAGGTPTSKFFTAAANFGKALGKAAVEVL